MLGLSLQNYQRIREQEVLKMDRLIKSDYFGVLFENSNL